MNLLLGFILFVKVLKKLYLLSDMIVLIGVVVVDVCYIFYFLIYILLYFVFFEGLKLVFLDGGVFCVYFIILVLDLFLFY